MRAKVLTFLTDRGTLVQREAVDYIMRKPEPMKFVRSVLDNLEEQPFMLTVEHLQKVEKLTRAKPPVKSSQAMKPRKQLLVKEKPFKVVMEKPLIPQPPKLVCSVSELPDEMKLYSDITGNSTCEGKIGDFKLYFNDRLRTLKKYIRTKREMAGAIPLSRIPRADGTFKIIGMVTEIRTTQRGNKLITLEDENSEISILLTKDNNLNSDPTVLDEIIGAVCSKFKDDGPRRNNRLVMAQTIVRPDIPVNRRPNRSDSQDKVAFVSDVHVGSKTFLKEEFDRFLSWLKGKEGQGVKYMVVPGDCVDGIGIYPDQEEELAIDDIYGQYEELARLLSDVPRDISVIMLPGNHDAVRPAEPQPTFPKEIRDLFSENVVFLGNPCYFSIYGVEILAYHGRSMDDFIKALPQLDYSKAKRIMVEMLKKRHLVPIYGGRTPIAPEHRDYLVIDRIPDIFVTGHGHATDLGKYHGVTLLNASAWQSQTKYQKMHNFQPDPAKVPLVNLGTGATEIKAFS
jgi:DNA polymerase II small subunit